MVSVRGNKRMKRAGTSGTEVNYFIYLFICNDGAQIHVLAPAKPMLFYQDILQMSKLCNGRWT
jgi:hypothetical protein